MVSNPADREKGESPMTDYQFEYVMKLKDRVAELTNELSMSLGVQEQSGMEDKPDAIGMSDYQFKQFESLRDKCEVLTKETNFLRMENAMLKSEVKKLKNKGQSNN